MPKRSAEEKINHYNRKIQKLQDKERRKYLRIADNSTESSDADTPAVLEEPVFNDVPTDDVDHMELAAVVTNDDQTPAAPVTVDPVVTLELPPDILMALGESIDDTPKYGEKIDDNLSNRWQPLLRKGLAKESKDILLKTYLIPENCSLLMAPKLNPEISAAMNDISRNRDKKLEAFQQQIGCGMTALNRGLSHLLKPDMSNMDKVQAIKQLSDSCRIFADLHFMETQVRTKAITPSLEKSFLNLIQEQERDETLFGKNLPEKIKASKAIEKQSSQIKKAGPSPKPSSSSTSAPARNRFQGNWQPPVRYPSNRGGRGGYKKTQYIPRKTPPSLQGKPTAPNHPKSRGPQQPQ